MVTTWPSQSSPDSSASVEDLEDDSDEINPDRFKHIPVFFFQEAGVRCSRQKQLTYHIPL